MRLKLIAGNLVIVLLVGLGSYFVVRTQLRAAPQATPLGTSSLRPAKPNAGVERSTRPKMSRSGSRTRPVGAASDHT